MKSTALWACEAALTTDLTPKYVPVLMIVQPIGFGKVGPGSQLAQGGDIPAHYAV
ncbi:MAG TPA: hypothetical protein G4N92_08840 [Anaerolineae bacterium]|nr:hypothetical protein [Anaerolineae bacterium]